MKFSLNLAQYYSDVDFKALPHDELIEKLGLQLGAIEDVIDYAPRYEGIVVVKVVSCEKHPDADKLSVCRVDDGGAVQNVERGEDGLVQVVCGAPNVTADAFAAWIPPGATVPASLNKEPFVLEAREIRGWLSNGMLASSSELDMSDDHEGILLLDSDEIGREPKVGEPISAFYGLDDLVVDCENKMFTHRPDCFGNLGIAREVAGIFGRKFNEPDWYWKVPEFKAKNNYTLNVKNDIPELVPRFMSVVMEDVSVGPSPSWLRANLRRVGIKPINNVVDVTNFVMHLTGQPTHAFDYDKLQKYSDQASLFPRMSKKGETLRLLGDKKIELTGDEVVISTDNQAVALAGIMGGADTEVDTDTKIIVIECATFDMYNVRRTSMRYGLFTDAVTRFNKGQSPLQNDRVLAYLMEQLQMYAGANQASNIADIRSVPEEILSSQSMSGELTINRQFITDRLGKDLSSDQICTLLQNVNFAARTGENNSDELLITAPFWRMDIAISEDIVEEVGRLHGYYNLPVSLPPRPTKPAAKNTMREFKMHLRYLLKERGANEVLTYSFVHGDLLKKCNINPEQWAYHLRNAISPDLQYYRPSLIPSLLAKVHQNIKAQAGSSDNALALYEIGKVHVKGHNEVDEPELPKQLRRLALVFAADTKTAKTMDNAYYQAKSYLDAITNHQAVYVPLDSTNYPITAPYLIGRSASVQVGDQVLGVVGEFGSIARKQLKLPEASAGFEIDIDLLQAQLQPAKYQPLSSFPETQQDVSFEVDENVAWQQLRDLFAAELAVISAEGHLQYSLEPLDIYQSEESEKKRLSYRVTLTHLQKTLKTDEVNKLLGRIAEVASEKLGAVRI